MGGSDKKYRESARHLLSYNQDIRVNLEWYKMILRLKGIFIRLTSEIC